MTLAGKEEKSKHKLRAKAPYLHIEAFNDRPFVAGSRYVVGKTLDLPPYHGPNTLTRYVPISVRSLSSDGSFPDVLGHGSVGSFNDHVVVDLRTRRLSVGTQESLSRELSRMEGKDLAGLHERSQEEQALDDYLKRICEEFSDRVDGPEDAKSKVNQSVSAVHHGTRFSDHVVDVGQANLDKPPVRLSWVKVIPFILAMTFSLDTVVRIQGQASAHEVTMVERGICLLIGLIVGLFIVA